MGEMASNLAHELNQPLTVIANNSEIALDMLAVGPEYRTKLPRVLQHTAGQALRAGDIIRRLRDFARQGTTDRIQIGFNGVIEETVALTAADALDKGAITLLSLAAYSGPNWTRIPEQNGQ